MMVQKLFGVALVLAGLVSGAHASEEVEIIKQGDAAVTLADVEGFMLQMPEDRRQGFLESQKRVDQMLISILRDKQLAGQATTMKLDQDPQVEIEIAFMRNQILAKKRMNAYEASIKVPSMDAAAKEQYLAHKADYVIPEVVDVQHVLISEKNRTDADAKALADKVRAEAVANPDGFAQLVEKYSDDPSKISNGGQIRGATSGRMVKEFAAAAQGLTKAGEISPVVKTTYGYHVLKLIRRTPSSQQDFATVKDELVAKLKESYIAEQRKAFLARLDQGAPSVNPQGMEALQQRYKLGSLPKIGETAHAPDQESK